MNKPEQNLVAKPQQGKAFHNVVRITGRVAHFDELGEPYVRLRLSCHHSNYLGLVWLNQTEIPEEMGHLSLVEVQGTYFSGIDPWVMVEQLTPVSRDALDQQPILHSLPRCYCPVPRVLDELVHTVNRLQSFDMKNFLRLVLERRERVEPFLKVPASGQYHHNQPGGLLLHSLEVANNIVAMIDLNEPGTSTHFKEIGFVAGLLHDIGKIYCFDTDGRRTASSNLVEHDALTLEVCAPGLAWLDRHAPETAITLRHLWTCASPGARYGQKPMMSLARYLRDADGQSALAENQRKAFAASKSGGFRSLGKNRYWLPNSGINSRFELDSNS